jgi:hypothetical protein
MWFYNISWQKATFKLILLKLSCFDTVCGSNVLCVVQALHSSQPNVSCWPSGINNIPRGHHVVKPRIVMPAVAIFSPLSSNIPVLILRLAFIFLLLILSTIMVDLFMLFLLTIIMFFFRQRIINGLIGFRAALSKCA